MITGNNETLELKTLKRSEKNDLENPHWHEGFLKNCQMKKRVIMQFLRKQNQKKDLQESVGNLKCRKVKVPVVTLIVALLALVCFENGKAQTKFGQANTLMSDVGFVNQSEIYTTDINGDNHPDVVLSEGGEIWWFENKGGSFGSKTQIASTGRNTFIFPSDVDGDGDVDIIVSSNSNIKWFENAGNGLFPGSGNTITSNYSGYLSVKDFTNNGSEDIIVASSNGIILFENNGNGTFSKKNTIKVPNYGPRSIEAGDIDGDNDQDILVGFITGFTTGKVSWFENDGNGNFGVEQKIVTNNANNIGKVKEVHLSDLTSDGLPEVIFADGDANWLENQGNGNFGSKNTVNITGGTDVFSSDLDGDNQLDLLSCSKGKDMIVWGKNLGGIFGKVDTISKQTDYPRLVYADDLNGNGKQDVIVAHDFGIGDGRLLWFENQGPPCTPYEVHTSSWDINCKGVDNGMARIDSVEGGVGPYIYDWSTNDNVDSIGNLSAGTYTVTVTDANNCKDTDTINITEPAPLSVQKSAQPDSTGNGIGEAMVTVNGGTKPYQYNWQGQTDTDSLITGLNRGFYQFTVTDSNGCSLTDSVFVCGPLQNTIQPQVCDSFTAPSGSNSWGKSGTYYDTLSTVRGCDSILTIDLTVTTIDTGINKSGEELTANPSGLSYQWLDCDNGYAEVSGATSQSFTPSSDGNYAVAVTQNNCTDTSSCYQVEKTTGIAANGEKAGFKVYPNPASDQLTIVQQDNLKPQTFQLQTLTGKRLKTGPLSGTKRIDVSNLSPGVYLLEVQGADAVRTKKVVVK